MRRAKAAVPLLVGGGGRPEAEGNGGVLEVDDVPARFLARRGGVGVGVARSGRRRRELDGDAAAWRASARVSAYGGRGRSTRRRG